MVRKYEKYISLFKQIGLHILSATRHDRWEDDKSASAEYACFILKSL